MSKKGLGFVSKSPLNTLQQFMGLLICMNTQYNQLLQRLIRCNQQIFWICRL